MLFCRCLGACFLPSAMVDLLTSLPAATSCLSRYSLSLLLWDQGLFGIFWPDSRRISFCLLHCSVCQFPYKCYENSQYGPDAKGKGLIQVHFFLFWNLLQSTLCWQGGNDVSQKNAFLIIWFQSVLMGSIHSPGHGTWRTRARVPPAAGDGGRDGAGDMAASMSLRSIQEQGWRTALLLRHPWSMEWWAWGD